MGSLFNLIAPTTSGGRRVFFFSSSSRSGECRENIHHVFTHMPRDAACTGKTKEAREVKDWHEEGVGIQAWGLSHLEHIHYTDVSRRYSDMPAFSLYLS